MARWIRFEHAGNIGFGTLEGDTITMHSGNMFENPSPSEEQVDLSSVTMLTPVAGGKMVCLWNNFRMMAAKMNLSIPEEPLYFIKSDTSFLAGGQTIRRPRSYDGKVIFEGELGVVIGKRCKAVSEQEAGDHIFGYTCVNDVTAVELLYKDGSFAQWTRAKSFDTFGVFGPVVATGLDPMALTVTARLNGDERQRYPVTDMVFSPHRLVSMISRDMTLLPGDIIACGTNVGVGSMKPRSTIEISIAGVGTLTNRYE